MHSGLGSHIKIVSCLSGGAGETPFDRGKTPISPKTPAKPPIPRNRRPLKKPKTLGRIFQSSLFLKMPPCPGKKMEESYRRNKQKWLENEITPKNQNRMKAGRFKPMFRSYQPCSPDSDARGPTFFGNGFVWSSHNEMTFSGVNITRIRWAVSRPL